MSKGAQTRKTILKAAFELMYSNGYQATSIDEILKKTNVTKGSFFYHFKNKDTMGVAMIDEIMYPGMYQVMIASLHAKKKPKEALFLMMENLLTNTEFFDVQYGCPAINLIEEMAPLNSSFRQALSKLSNEWRQAIEDCLVRARSAGEMNSDVNVKEVSLFIMSGYAGIRNLGKLYGTTAYGRYLNEFQTYLNRL